MASYPIKMLKDEKQEPFVPVVSPGAVIDASGKTLDESLNEKLGPDNLIQGNNIIIEKNKTNCTISAKLPQGLNVVDNLTTENSGEGALDAHQGKVLKDSIPSIANNLTTISDTQALSAYQGYILDNKIKNVENRPEIAVSAAEPKKDEDVWFKSSRNLLCIEEGTKNSSGIQASCSNNVIRVKGTASGVAIVDFKIKSPISKNVGILVKSLNPTGSYNGLETSLRNSGGNPAGLWSDNAGNVSGNLEGDAYFFRIQVLTGKTIDCEIKVQIEKGNKITPFAPCGDKEILIYNGSGYDKFNLINYKTIKEGKWLKKLYDDGSMEAWYNSYEEPPVQTPNSLIGLYYTNPIVLKTPVHGDSFDFYSVTASFTDLISWSSCWPSGNQLNVIIWGSPNDSPHGYRLTAYVRGRWK